MNNDRDYSMDFIRITAMVLIIFMHTPIPNVGTPGPVLSSLSFFTAPGIGLFFMISGALLLGNELSQRDFLKKRFSKVLWPTLFWTGVYIGVKFITTPSSVSYTAITILSIPFSAQGHGVLWFMYTLAGLYLLTPILSKWLKNASRKEIEFYLLLWCITLLYPYLKLVLKINMEPSGILYYFTGYCGYFLLGYYIKTHILPRSIRRTTLLWSCATVIACFLLVYLAKKIDDSVNIIDLFWYLSLPVAIMCVAYCMLLSQVQVPNRFKTVVTKLSTLSFGVYLCHILIMRTLLWNINFIHNCGAIIHIPIVAILTIILSWLLAFSFSKLPFSKYIIGV